MSEYDDLLIEVKKKVHSLAKEYVPKLYQALREEGLSQEDARDRVEKDCIPIWAKETIRKWMPEEAKNPNVVDAAKVREQKKKIVVSDPTNSSSFSLTEPESKRLVQVTNDGTSRVEDDSKPIPTIASHPDIRLPIKLDLAKYFPALNNSYRSGRKQVTLIHDGGQVVEIKYDG